MAVMEEHCIIHTDAGTQYRVRPNPDGTATDGSDGIVFEWRDPTDEKWSGYFFVAPDAIPSLMKAMQKFGGKD
jgi:hypothetical protein